MSRVIAGKRTMNDKAMIVVTREAFTLPLRVGNEADDADPGGGNDRMNFGVPTSPQVTQKHKTSKTQFLYFKKN